MSKRLCVRAILKTKEGRIGLVHRIKRGKEYWVAPGGGVEPNEAYHDALRREIREEVGAEIADISPQPIFRQETDCHINLYFSCRETSRTEPQGEEYFLFQSPNNLFEIQYLEPSRIGEVNLVPPELRPLLPNLLKGSDEPLT